ncbi:MAG: trigger factor [Bacteroidetes bacterium]|nr:trigger factor [Bacteroidota bacterium]
MNISHETTGDLTATIKIEIPAGDYQEEVEKVLREHRRKASMPGFRPGHVPYGMIRRIYGNSVLAEEINKLITASLDDYIKKNEFDIIGIPIVSKDKSKEQDFDKQSDFEFYFDIGLTPKFALTLTEDVKVNQYIITFDDKMVDNQITEYQYRFGKSVIPDAIGEDDILRGDIAELDESGTIKENGINKSTSLMVRYIKDETIKSMFLGSKAGDRVRYNPLKASESTADTASLLGITKEEAENLTSDLEFTIHEISRFEPAPVDRALFDKVYQNHYITTEEDFRTKVRQDVEARLRSNSEGNFMSTVVDILMKQANIELPDDFIKRYLVETGKEGLTAEQVEKDYDKYARSMKWQLIENRLIKDYNLGITDEEKRNYIRNYFKGLGHDHEHEHEEYHGKNEKMEELVNLIMQNEEEVRKINDYLYDTKLKNLFKDKLGVIESEVSYEDFIKLASESKP